MRGKCKITFEGLNVNRLLNTLVKKGVTLCEVEREGKKCSVTVPAQDIKHTIALLEERCYNIIGKKFIGTTALVEYMRKRFLFPIFCALCVVAIALSSQHCLAIEVSGDFDQASVLSALDEIGVSVGTNMSKLNVNNLQNALANKLDAMYAVITRYGSVVYVNAVKRKEISPPIDLSVRRDIVANRDGVVKELLCEEGTALVKVGDTVSRGDVLIEGKRLFNDGTFQDVYAMGRVVLEISAVGYAQFDGYRTETVETGNVFICRGVVLFGKEYRRDCPFEQYTHEAKDTFLYPLNLCVRTNIFRETHTVRVSATIDECLDDLREKAYLIAMNNCNFTVSSTEYVVDSNGVTATLYGRCVVQ